MWSCARVEGGHISSTPFLYRRTTPQIGTYVAFACDANVDVEAVLVLLKQALGLYDAPIEVSTRRFGV